MSLKTYLQKHFVDKLAFASLLGITVERLDQLIAAKAVPQPEHQGQVLRCAPAF